ncbi:uncharacterized protein LOC120012503 [Tripterygium wilfordii]|uniref:uncharacterized protein LOC120012503 n=1 Tax=Tripterygium wilfordii TaxID=458696 RepID=UPI0018F7F56F|nr:uncharacterized protein LOC120012503 [Tripterygium wilfordii]
MAGDSSNRRWSFFRRRANIVEEESSDESDEDLYAFEQHEIQNATQMLTMMVSPCPVQPRTRINIHRNREMAHNDLVRDYFAPNCTYPPHMFRRRFRMRRELFLRIKDDLEATDTYFQRLPDCTRRLGLSAIQKMAAALRILAYGGLMDSLDEYSKIGESTAKVALNKFCENILVLYKDQYLRTPTMNATMQLMEENAARGFPSMIGSLDCMHWEWRGCPSAWKGQYLGHYDNLGSSSLRSHAKCTIHCQWVHLPHALLSDGWNLSAICCTKNAINPSSTHQVFARTHESVRKDVERAFGVLQAKWGITKEPVRYYKTSELKKIMLTCIILHNMIIDDKRHIDIDPWMPPSDEVVSTIDTITTPKVLAQYIHSRIEQIRDDQINASLKMDLMAHIWILHGNLQI